MSKLTASKARDGVRNHEGFVAVSIDSERVGHTLVCQNCYCTFDQRSQEDVCEEAEAITPSQREATEIGDGA